MTERAASETVLGELHSKVARVMTQALDVYDTAQEIYLNTARDKIEEGQVIPEPVLSAPLLGVMTKFLADNKISCVPADSKELSDLEKRLKSKRKRVASVGNVVHLDHE